MNRGLLSRSAAAIASVAQVVDCLHISPILRWILLGGIRVYQRYLSPHKGFTCAHRQVYGGLSCSEYLRRSVKTDDLSTALHRFQSRLRSCKGASRMLRASLPQSGPQSQKRRQKRETCGDCSVGWCDSSCMPLDVCDVFEFCDLDCDVIDGCGDFGDCGGCDCG